MAFTLEDGTGISGANAYIDTAFADGYHGDRGFSAWEFSDVDKTVVITSAQKQAAIVVATDHIDRVFGHLFRGYKASKNQSLEWPRVAAFDPYDYELSGVPEALKKATAEYALRSLLLGTLTTDPPPRNSAQSFSAGSVATSAGSGSGEVVKTKKKVGPIETETEYAGTRSSGSSARVAQQLENYPAADLLLRPLLRSRTTHIVRG